MISAFEGNKAETKTMLPVIQAFMSAHRLPGVTVVAEAGMISEANPEGDRGSRAEKSFRMSRSDLQARPIYHRKRDSIDPSWLRLVRT